MAHISIESIEEREAFIRHQGGRGKVHKCSFFHADLDKHDSTWTLHQGLAAGYGSNTFSIESTNYPGYFLRHRAYELWADKFDGTPLNAVDATFRLVPSLLNQHYMSLESVNYPGHFVSKEGDLLFLRPFEDSEAFKRRITFVLHAPLKQ